MKKLLTIILASVFFTACGGTGSIGSTGGTPPTQLKVLVNEQEKTLDIKSIGVFYGKNVLNNVAGKAKLETFRHSLYFANFDADFTKEGAAETAMTAPDQVVVRVSLTGEDGTKEDSPLKVGTYSVKNEWINDVNAASIMSFQKGTKTETQFSPMSTMTNTEGEVKITSVTADTVSGEINLTETGRAIKGTFTAKLPKAKTQ